MDLIKRIIVFVVAAATVPVTTTIGTHVSFSMENAKVVKQNLALTDHSSSAPKTAKPFDKLVATKH